MNTDNRIPVTIITGFLGAGKTSFINWFIQTYKNKNLAVIENEFGEISIDVDLLNGISKNSIYNITNGCICCSAKTAFVDLLDNYLNTFRKLDHLLIESTGIADPTALVLPFYNNYGLQLNFKLQNVICLVDVVNFLHSKNQYSELQNQIAMADIVILNKTDLVSHNNLIPVKEQINILNPMAGLYEAINGITKKTLNFNNSKHLVLHPSQQIILAQNPLTEHNLLNSVSLEFKRVFNKELLTLNLTELINSQQFEIIRSKGIFYIDKEPFVIQIQSVKNLIVIKPIILDEITEKKSKIVFIGKNITEKQLKNKLDNLHVRTQP